MLDKTRLTNDALQWQGQLCQVGVCYLFSGSAICLSNASFTDNLQAVSQSLQLQQVRPEQAGRAAAKTLACLQGTGSGLAVGF